MFGWNACMEYWYKMFVCNIYLEYIIGVLHIIAGGECERRCEYTWERK